LDFERSSGGAGTNKKNQIGFFDLFQYTTATPNIFLALNYFFDAAKSHCVTSL